MSNRNINRQLDHPSRLFTGRDRPQSHYRYHGDCKKIKNKKNRPSIANRKQIQWNAMESVVINNKHQNEAMHAPTYIFRYYLMLFDPQRVQVSHYYYYYRQVARPVEFAYLLQEIGLSVTIDKVLMNSGPENTSYRRLLLLLVDRSVAGKTKNKRRIRRKCARARVCVCVCVLTQFLWLFGWFV